MAETVSSHDGVASKEAPARAVRETYLDQIVDVAWKRPGDLKPGELCAHDLAKNGIKTASLFLGKKLALFTSAATYALDEASNKDSVGEQAVDLTLGSVKGAALAKTFNWLGAKDFNIAAKGVALGTTSRAIENTFTRGTYFNNETGGYDAMLGASRAFHNSVNLRAAATDVAVFGTSHFMLKGLDRAGLAHLRQSKLAGTMLTGSTFGMSGGAYHEVMRQSEAGESFDFAKIVKSSLAHGLVDGLASGPGGLRAAVSRTAELDRHAATTPFRERLGVPEKTNYMIETPVKGEKNFQNMEDFMTRGIKAEPTPSRIYEVSGHKGRLIVPEEFASRLDRVREQRDIAAQKIEKGDGLGKRFSVFGARLKLDMNANRSNALPEEVVAAMDKAPDRRFFQDIRLESKSPYEQWHREKYKRGENVEGELYKSGDMSLFGTKTGRDAELFLQHEWTHIAEKYSTATREAFDRAAKMEGKMDDDAYMFRDYADVNSSENWAVHYGEVLLAGNRGSFERMASNAPLRTAVLAKSLSEIISEVPAAQRSSVHPELVDRIEYVNQKVLPNMQGWFKQSTNPDVVALKLFLFPEKGEGK